MSEKECPDCGEVMPREDRGYVYCWSCENQECGNVEGYWRIYNWDVFEQVKLVQERVGKDAAGRLAWEFDQGVLQEQA
jgi:uncharacterized Zn finger protein (UPF0148 family)